ncbi:unnamed protein product [Owenia fusiformis]|uniref:Uncharacterized protein n=1 Tax=Owenia fusiformis TaxID=6347 RepID=A0A8J1Y1S6_OWEFU|nr:unnamed protein product [Owenia fusiformis]
MKATIAFLLLAVVASIHTSDAWRIRLPRLGLRRIIAPVCSMYCNTKCTLPGICAPVCHKVCNIGRKRRSVAINDDEKPFSSDLSKYDSDNDDKVTLSEFAEAISSTPEKCTEAFGMADENGDGVLDMGEFLRGPFRFTSEEVEQVQDTPDRIGKYADDDY